MQSIIDACKDGSLPASPVVIISNNAESGALQRAAAEGIAAHHISSTSEGSENNADQAIADTLERHKVDLVVLAGYMKRIGPRTLSSFNNRILNIHPCLLPKYGGQGMYGMRVHEAVIEAGDNESGVTIHLVNEEYDQGDILAQEKVPVLQGDTAQSLADRVLQLEHKLYPETIANIIKGKINPG